MDGRRGGFLGLGGLALGILGQIAAGPSGWAPVRSLRAAASPSISETKAATRFCRCSGGRCFQAGSPHSIQMDGREHHGAALYSCSPMGTPSPTSLHRLPPFV
jgi:hypothetical protein